MGGGVVVATRYVVSWVGDCGKPLERRFAFMPGAVDFWQDLVNAEIRGVAGVSGAGLTYLGPNGERMPESEVSPAFSKAVGEAVGGNPPKNCPAF